MNSSNQKEQEREPGGSTSSPRGGDDEPKIISEIRGVLDSGKHTSVAAQHYRAGATDAETVAEYVSQDLYRNIDGAAKLLPFVRIALGESEIAS